MSITRLFPRRNPSKDEMRLARMKCFNDSPQQYPSILTVKTSRETVR